MSVQDNAWAVRQSLKPKQKFLLLILSDAVNGHDHTGTVSASRLSERTGIKPHRIDGLLGRLERARLIEYDWLPGEEYRVRLLIPA